MDKSKCADCGAAILPHVGKGRPRVRCNECSDMRNKTKHAEWSKEYRKIYDGYEQTCKQCGTVFKNQSYRAHCSEACNTAYLEGRKRKATCKKCGVEFRPKNPRHWQYCSRVCSYADIKTWYNANNGDGVQRYSEVKFKKCVVCGEDFTTDVRGQISCVLCAGRLAEHNVSRAKRPSKIHITRAKKCGVPHERFDPLLVFERAEWVCQICGISTPVSKRGTYDDDAPELDHIVPISRGGAHSLENSQCACRQCNRRKSNIVTPTP